MKIGVTSVFVPNPVDAFKFYTEVLGFVEKLYQPEHWIAIVVSPEQPDGTALMLEPNHNAIARNYQQALYKANIPCIVFTVSDIHAEYERLKARGVVFRKPPKKTSYGTEAVFEDACGNLIQLQEERI
jgi:catechol 2,3-dioxygenase-like lactoylglutathione lyase family enzyme